MHAERISEPPMLIFQLFVGIITALHTSITQITPKRRGTLWGIFLVLISHTVAIPITMSTPIHTHGDGRVKKSPIYPSPSLRIHLHVSEIQRTKMRLVIFGDMWEFLAINTLVIPVAHKTFPRARQRCWKLFVARTILVKYPSNSNFHIFRYTHGGIHSLKGLYAKL